MKIKTKEFKLNRFFVLYDMNDNPILFIDSYKELIHVYKRPISEIAFRFDNTNEDYIIVLIDGVKHKLYAFKDED